MKLNEKNYIERDESYLAVRLQQWKENKKKASKDYAIVEVPVRLFGRFVQLHQCTGREGIRIGSASR